MNLRIVWLPILCLAVAAIPAWGQVGLLVFDNGPVNGNDNAWTINFGFSVSDSFAVCAGQDLDALHFYAWVAPGDVATSVEVQVGNTGYFSNNLFDQSVSLTQSDCVSNGSFDVCLESVGDAGGFIVGVGSGHNWLTLSNASTLSGNPVYWDQNSGVSCGGDNGTGGECPSKASEIQLGPIPSETFTWFGQKGRPNACPCLGDPPMNLSGARPPNANIVPSTNTVGPSVKAIAVTKR